MEVCFNVRRGGKGLGFCFIVCSWFKDKGYLVNVNVLYVSFFVFFRFFLGV